MSDVPLGAMLSGGLDSSLIVALMARNISGPLKTFSVGFREDRQNNELADARLVSQAFGTDHHELELSVDEQQIDLEQLVWFLDEPVADPLVARISGTVRARRPTCDRCALWTRCRRAVRRLHEAPRGGGCCSLCAASRDQSGR